MSEQHTEEFRSGFVCFVGRPNTGKSTLTNALVGEKVAITSEKPQTTRRAIRGIVNRPGGQLVLVDTPGIHRPRTLLGQRLNDLVEQVLGDVDVIAGYTSDGLIAKYDLVVLDDPRQAIPPYDAVVLLSPKRANDVALITALQPLLGRIDIATMREANLRAAAGDGDRSASGVARWLWQRISSNASQ